MTRYMKIAFVGSIVLLAIAASFNFFQIPNRVILVIISFFLLLFIYLTSYIVRSMPKIEGLGWRTLELLSYIFLLLLMFMLIGGLIFRSSTFLIVTIVLAIAVFGYFVFKARGDLSWSNLHIKTASLFLTAAILSLLSAPIETQEPDAFYDPGITDPAFSENQGPAVFLDEAHENFHKLDGLYSAFGNVLRSDGYKVNRFTDKFQENTLEKVDILVIANAISVENKRKWVTPIKSAFTDEEIESVSSWVEEGGSLFLIADHMPFPGATDQLASAFGFEFKNGFAMDTVGQEDIFTFEDGLVFDNVISRGKADSVAIRQIKSFTGQAFPVPADARPLYVLDSQFVQWEPDTAWNFKHVDPYPVGGFAQAAYKEFGTGRVVVAGEAAMYTSQLFWGLSWIKIGLGAEGAKDNQLLLRNIMLWLSKEI